MLSILIGSTVANQPSEEPVILHDDRPFSGDGLTHDAWKSHLSLEEPIGTTFTAKVHVFLDSVFCTGPGVLVPISASQIVEKNAEADMKRHCRSVDGQ